MVDRGKNFALGGSRGPSASWRGNGPPRQRRVAGLRERSATLELRHGPDSYGRQQWGIFRNGRKPDGAIPREGSDGLWVVNLFYQGGSSDVYLMNKHRLTPCQQPR